MTENRPHRHAPGLVVVGLTSVLLMVGCPGKKKKAQPRTEPAVVVVDPEEDGRPEPLAEKEPNDSRAAAQDLVPDGWIGGRIQTVGSEAKADHDWYRVTVAQQDRILRANLSGVAGLDLVLEAFSAEGKRLMRVDNNRDGGGEVLVNLAPPQGVIFLRVRAGKGSNPNGVYRIGYTLRAREEGEEAEPNWKTALATPLKPDEEAMGFLGWPTDTDFYLVNVADLPAGSRIRVEYDGVDDVMANLSFRGADGKVIQQRWSGRGNGVVLSNLVLPEDQQKVHVVVRCHRDTNVENRYFLRLLTAVPSGPTEAEPNDDPKHATPLFSGRVTAGQIPDRRDVDLYTLATDRPMLVEVKVTPPMGLDLALALVDAGGKVIHEVNQGTARQPELLASVPLQPPGATFRVRSVAGDTGGQSAYHIAAQVSGGPAMEQEPNDKVSLASPWPTGQRQLSANLLPAGDVDHHRLVAADEQLALVVQAQPGARIKAEILDGVGERVARGVTEQGGAVVRIKAAVAPNRDYVLRVSGGKPAKGDPLAGYTVKLEDS